MTNYNKLNKTKQYCLLWLVYFAKIQRFGHLTT